ncbi:NAD(P)-dependent oxidoreductase [Nocardia cyriacigeorgica]|uniref:NAD(P)-dependent oxidoreductase n=1 Tax=Nocardia cyriacigeorgica TaxID=135487 RepID=A0A5R8P7V3_9NOCA|nr:NAD(P)-dependent oxidoreductase [Nocardia cyriacigeorgica]TLF98260.1 NAD(P)-dependent oxidoreductase [Nocardia cyriacigeorgica]
MSKSVGFLGPGQMGEPMVGRLVGAGYRTVVYARKEPVRQRLRDAGATVVDSIAEASADHDVVIVCVFSDEQLLDVLDGPAGVLACARRDAVVVSHTTGAVSTLVGLAEAHPDGPVLLDGPVSGSAKDIEKGQLTVFLGGPDSAVESVRPVLSAYANTVIPTGARGSALAMKLVNNALFAANAQLVALAGDLGRRMGIDEEQMLTALSVASGNSFAAESIRRTGGFAAFEKRAAPFLRKDVAACLEATTALGVDLGRLGTVIADGPFDLS